MKTDGRGRRVLGTFLALLVAAACPALAGDDYLEACNLIRRGDPKGLELMERVCSAEKFASNAFLDLSRGYLRISKDAAMAMDAALRGLESYNDTWEYRVPKQSLYTAFATAADQAKPEALAQHVPRLAKLAKRDGSLVEGYLAKYEQYLPGKVVGNLVAQAQAAEARGALGAALALLDKAAEAAKAGGVEADFVTALKHGRELGEAARAELAAALALVAAKNYDAGLAELEKLSRKYEGGEVGKGARARLDELAKSGEVQAARDAARDKEKAAKAEAALAAARELLAAKDYPRALGALREVAAMAGTPAAAAA